jgi:hypothetical protein
MLDIGEVLSDTFASIQRTFVVLANLAVLFVAIPAAINIAGAALTPIAPIFGLLSFIGLLAQIVGQLLVYAAVYLVAMADLHQTPVHTEGLLKTAAGRFWPLLGLALLLGIGVFIGCLLLIVPGLILAVAWSVAMPVLVLENRGVIESFRRSAELTRGKRWSIFLLFVVVTLVIVVVELALTAVFGGFQGLVSRRPSLSSVVVSQLLSVITVPFFAVLTTSLFNQLRGKAGYGVEAVAEVFA